MPSSTVISPGPTCFQPVRSLPLKSCFHPPLCPDAAQVIVKPRNNTVNFIVVTFRGTQIYTKVCARGTVGIRSIVGTEKGQAPCTLVVTEDQRLPPDKSQRSCI